MILDLLIICQEIGFKELIKLASLNRNEPTFDDLSYYLSYNYSVIRQNFGNLFYFYYLNDKNQLTFIHNQKKIIKFLKGCNETVFLFKRKLTSNIKLFLVRDRYEILYEDSEIVIILDKSISDYSVKKFLYSTMIDLFISNNLNKCNGFDNLIHMLDGLHYFTKTNFLLFELIADSISNYLNRR